MASNDDFIRKNRHSIINLVSEISRNSHRYSLDSVLKILNLLLSNGLIEKIIISTHTSIEFQPSEISGVSYDECYVKIDTNRFGIIGNQSNLPDKYVENYGFLFNSIQEKGYFYSLLSIFNDILLQESFFISQKSFFALQSGEFNSSVYFYFLQILTGNAISNDYFIDIFFENIMWKRTKSLQDVCYLLSNVINNKFELVKNRANFRKISSKNNILGKNFCELNNNFYIGNCVWDNEFGIEIKIFDINFIIIIDFFYNKLPKIYNYIYRYVHISNIFFEIVVDFNTISPATLQKKIFYLGMNSFLYTNNKDKYQKNIKKNDITMYNNAEK